MWLPDLPVENCRMCLHCFQNAIKVSGILRNRNSEKDKLVPKGLFVELLGHSMDGFQPGIQGGLLFTILELGGLSLEPWSPTTFHGTKPIQPTAPKKPEDGKTKLLVFLWVFSWLKSVFCHVKWKLEPKHPEEETLSRRLGSSNFSVEELRSLQWSLVSMVSRCTRGALVEHLPNVRSTPVARF